MTVGETCQPYEHLFIRATARNCRHIDIRGDFGAFAGSRGTLVG